MNAENGWNLEHSYAEKALACHCGTKTKQRLRCEGMRVAICAECIEYVHFKIYRDSEQVFLTYQGGKRK